MAADHPTTIGPYEVIGELGRGAMGVVFRARQRGLDREVALKVLPLGADAEAAERFRREARLSARLRHPHIVAVHDVGEADGRLYLAMDLIRGHPLSSWLDEDSPGPRRSAELVRAIADAVAHAHQQGILHRDIKPGNILVDTEGRPFLADFGLARAVSGDEGSKLSRTGNILGTPAYMSPEQAQGLPLDGRSDIWALGAVLYELLSTQPPFGGDSAVHVLAEVVHREPVPLRRRAPGTPRDLESIVHRCLEKSPARRYADAGELVADLDHFLEGRPVRARPLTTWRSASAWLRRNRALAATAAAGVCAVAAVLVYVTAILPAWQVAAHRARLTTIEARARTGAAAESVRLAAALDALTARGATPSRDQVEALRREAQAEAIAARVTAALPAELRPAAGETAAAAALAAGLATYRSGPLQARAAVALGDHALAYRLDPVGEAGLAAAIEVARRIADERRLGDAAHVLRGIRGRHRQTAAARAAVALLARVYAELGDWDAALAAAEEAAAAGVADALPPEALAVLRGFGSRRQELRVAPPARPDLQHFTGGEEPLRLCDLGRAGAPEPTILLPWRSDPAAIRVGPDGKLVAAPSPFAVLAPGTRVVDVAAGDMDGDGVPELFAAIQRAGVGSGYAILGRGSDTAWRVVAEDVSSAYTTQSLVAGDADGDGRLEAIVLFHYQAGGHWLVHWDRAAAGPIRVEWAPRGLARPWVRAGVIGDLDGDGTPEVALATTLHTSAEVTAYRWRGDGLQPLASLFVGEPGHSTLIPDPARPGGRLLAMLGEVAAELTRPASVPADAPGDDGLYLARFDGTAFTRVAHHPASVGDPQVTALRAVSAGRLGGEPVCVFSASRDRAEPGKRYPEGLRLRFCVGDPLRPPVVLAPPVGVVTHALYDVDGDGADELLLLSWETLEVRGRRTGAAPPLPLTADEAPARSEVEALLAAGRDLIGFESFEAARDLLAEVAARFAGTPEAAEATRLRVDVAVRGARRAREAAVKAMGEGRAGAAEAEAKAVEAFRAAAIEARTAAGASGAEPARARRLFLQAAEAAREGLDWPTAVEALARALDLGGGPDDDRVLRRDLDGWQRLVQLAAAPPVALREVGRLVADDPTRVRRLPDGTLEFALDSHHAHGVVGALADYGGEQAIRLSADVEVEGSAWSTGLRFGLVPRDAVPDPGRLNVTVWMHGVTQWDLQSLSLGQAHPWGGLAYGPGRWFGRWHVAWAYLPEADLVTLEVTDRDTGACVYRDRRTAGPAVPAGRYVLGVQYDNWGGDCFLSHQLHPSVTTVRIGNLTCWHPPGAMGLAGTDPASARELHLEAGGALLRGDAPAAAGFARRALDRDPGAVRTRLLLALALARTGAEGEAAAQVARAIRTDAYRAAVVLDDACRAAAAADVLAYGRLLRRVLAETPPPSAGDPDAAVRRGLCLAGLGDLAASREALVAGWPANDGPAFRYLRRRGQWGPGEELNEDWEWMKTRGTIPPGTEPPVVIWAPAPGETVEAVREAARRARAVARARPSRENVLTQWVATSRLLLVAPDDPDGLLWRGEVGIALVHHGLAERDWRRRAAVLPEDPEAALLVARLYAVRKATRETLRALEEAVARGTDLQNLDREVEDALGFLAEHPRWKELRETGRR